MEQPFLSVIMPAYNEGQRLPSSLTKIAQFLPTLRHPSELIVVDDGSKDSTAAIVHQYAKKYPFISLLSTSHGGKGHAVKNGMLSAKGNYLFACDADLSMPINEIVNFLPPVAQTYDVAIGSREVPGAQRYYEPSYRHLMGRVFNTIVRSLVVRGFADTQAGFKCFRREVANAVFSYQTIDGWAFDVEILHIAQKQGYRIIEIPIQWYYKESSQVRPVQDTVNMFREVLRIRRNSMKGLYDVKYENQIASTTAST